MCLTGLDYFSTLGYQPGIAALAAGLLSPVATVVLVLVTLAGALPVYRRVAAESPHGAGSIAMLERLLTFWQGQLFVLVLLGFAATDFLITVTLSTADATEHLVENPHVPSSLQGHEVVITLVLIALLGAVFLKGFTEAMGVAVVLVGAYLTLNAVVVADAPSPISPTRIWAMGSAPPTTWPPSPSCGSLFPRYLPRYGMAPHWARAVRPMVLVFTAVAFLVTWLFDADVNAQGGAYATGVLVLITSAAVAVTIAARRARQRGWTIAFGVISAIFVYTTLANVIERPDGVKIGACFIAAILLISILSRILRAFELRVTAVSLDDVAAGFLDNGTDEKLRLIANEPNSRDVTEYEYEYEEKLQEIQQDHDIPPSADMLFVEITLRDPSEFETELNVRGELMHGRYRVLALESAAVPNALAALLLHLRDRTGRRPHIYFEWTEGNPITHFVRFLMFGQGEVAPITREVLREAEPDRSHRPHVHVG